MNRPELRITTEPDTYANLSCIAAAVDAGQTTGHSLNYPGIDLLFQELTPNRWRLLEQMIGREPMSLRGIARFLQREYRRVYDDVRQLAKVGLMEQDGNGLWYCPYSEIHIDMALRQAA